MDDLDKLVDGYNSSLGNLKGLTDLTKLQSGGGGGGLLGNPLLLRFGMAALVMISFWILAVLLAKKVRRHCDAHQVDDQIKRLMSRLVRFAVLLVGVISALGTMGMDVTALIVGLFLFAFALGYALRDILANFLAGILVLLHAPFQLQQRITVGGFRGVVEEVNLRHTVLRENGAVLLVPNSVLFNSGVTIHADTMVP